jgi:hypothetical protein
VNSAENLQLFVRAQHAKAFRRLLWRRIIGMILAWVLVAWGISLSRAAMIVGIVVLSIPALWAIPFERRAIRDVDAGHFQR